MTLGIEILSKFLSKNIPAFSNKTKRIRGNHSMYTSIIQTLVKKNLPGENAISNKNIKMFRNLRIAEIS
jgi:hypothetical protein